MTQEQQKGLRALGMCTSHQRATIRTLLYRCDLPTDYITLQHRDLFAEYCDARDGRVVNNFLLELTMLQASNLIRALQAKVNGR